MKKIFTLSSVLMLLTSGQAQITYPLVATYAGTGAPGLVDGTYTAAKFNGPYGICHDPVTDAIYVADGFNHCIRKLLNGIAITVAGNGVPGDVDGVGSNARFNNPTGVFYMNGYVYICDDLNNKIKRMDATYNVVTIAGTGIQGFANGPALSAKFKQPKSIVVDTDDVIYVADYENHMIRKIEAGVVTTVAGTGSAGDGLGAALSAELYRPRDLCIDAAGNLYFVDLGNNRVKVLTTLGMVELVAGSGINGSTDGFGAAATFSTPVGIDWEASGVLMVIDALDPKLRRVTVGGVVTTVAGSGLSGFYDGASSLARFGLPQDLCFDNLGNMYIGDRDNDRIRVLHAVNTEGIFTPTATLPLPLHPNPTTGQVFLDLSSISEAITGAAVYSESGSLVLSIEGTQIDANSGTLMIDASGWAAGRYAVLVNTRSRIYRSEFVR